MSALCQKQTFCAAVKTVLFDHLVGYGEHARRNGQAKKFRGLLLYSTAHPKSFISAWRNRPAHADESSQWRARFEACELTRIVIMISEYLCRHCSSRRDIVGRVGTVNAGKQVTKICRGYFALIPKCLHRSRALWPQN